MGGGGGDPIGKAIKSVGRGISNVSNSVANIPGIKYTPFGAMAEVSKFGGRLISGDKDKKPGPEAPGTDPRMQALIDRQSAETNSFEQQMPGLTSQMQQQSQLAQKQQTAQEKEGIRGRAQGRGLLYSGLRQGSEAGAEARGAATQAQKNIDVNEQMQGGLRKMQDQLAGMQMGQYQSDLARADSIYNAALNRSKSNMQASQAAGSAAGSLVGSYLGK